jgi:hypothetical protein
MSSEYRGLPNLASCLPRRGAVDVLPLGHRACPQKRLPPPWCCVMLRGGTEEGVLWPRPASAPPDRPRDAIGERDRAMRSDPPRCPSLLLTSLRCQGGGGAMDDDNDVVVLALLARMPGKDMEASRTA